MYPLLSTAYCSDTPADEDLSGAPGDQTGTPPTHADLGANQIQPQDYGYQQARPAFDLETAFAQVPVTVAQFSYHDIDAEYMSPLEPRERKPRFDWRAHMKKRKAHAKR